MLLLCFQELTKAWKRILRAMAGDTYHEFSSRTRKEKKRGREPFKLAERRRSFPQRLLAVFSRTREMSENARTRGRPPTLPLAPPLWSILRHWQSQALKNLSSRKQDFSALSTFSFSGDFLKTFFLFISDPQAIARAHQLP
jgi:hypothetical protein